MDANNDSAEFVNRLKKGDTGGLADAFDFHRNRLQRMLMFRMDPRLRGRVDEDDILQEAFMNAEKRLQHYLNQRSMSLFVWIRLITEQTLIDVHRRHLGTKMRSAGREKSPGGGLRNSSSQTLSQQFLAGLTSPSQAAIREETAHQLHEALEQMSEIDREVLALRHFEELTNSEVAEILEITPKAASIRYVRALTRLKGVLAQLPGFSEISPNP